MIMKIARSRFTLGMSLATPSDAVCCVSLDKHVQVYFHTPMFVTWWSYHRSYTNMLIGTAILFSGHSALQIHAYYHDYIIVYRGSLKKQLQVILDTSIFCL